MPSDKMRSLTLAEAVVAHEGMAVPLRPATLHPQYVATDAVRSGALHPTYLSFEAQGERWMHGFHMTDVPGTSYRDASSPYGYGGPLSSTGDAAFLAAAWRAYLEWMREQRVVVEYVRFHPALGNERHYGGNVVDSRAVVAVDLTADDVTAGYASRLRQTLKKAAGAGLVYEEVDLGPHAREFRAYHAAAMREVKADPFYLFADQYYERLAATGLARLGICRQSGRGDAPWLAAALFLDGRGMREYHLAATNAEGRRLGASSFALHEGTLAARRQGMQMMYLGGGTDTSPENPLLFFKGAYSTQRLTYRTGWTVFDAAAYDDLERLFAPERAAHPERPVFHRIV